MGHTPPLSPAKELAQANAQAHRRWGAEGRAWHPAGEVKGGESWCVVGVTCGFPDERRWAVYGLGPTWADAWKDAEERGH